MTSLQHVSTFRLALPECFASPAASDHAGDDPDEAAASMLERTGRYRILRRLEARPVSDVDLDRLPMDREVGIVVDTETTGLDFRRHEIIELGMVAFTFDPAHRIDEVVGVFGGLREPSAPLPEHISRLTGITTDMVRGRSIDLPEVAAFARRASIVLAHNAQFDRPFLEKAFPVFRDLPWACSLKEVDWKELGSESGKLGHLLADIGSFHDGHRAVDDCHALLEVLDHARPDGGTAFARLMKATASASVEICAFGSPFSTKDALKDRGYRWSTGTDGWLKGWRIEVREEVVEAELRFLQEKIYGRDVDLPQRRLDALSRYR